MPYPFDTDDFSEADSLEDILANRFIAFFAKTQKDTQVEPSDDGGDEGGGGSQIGQATIDPNNPHLSLLLNPTFLKKLERLLLLLLNNPGINLSNELIAELKREFRFNRVNVAKIVEKLVLEATRGNTAAKVCVNELVKNATAELSALTANFAKKLGLDLKPTPSSMRPRPEPE